MTRFVLFVLTGAMLAGCGGGDTGTAASTGTPEPAPVTSAPGDAFTAALVALVRSAPDAAEPAGVDGTALAAPDNGEPLALE